MMQDSSLFANSADLTTKDILKKYADIAKSTPAARPHLVQGHSPPRSKEGRAPPPVFHRVETGDKLGGNNEAWSNESSVRHVNTPPQPQPQRLDAPNYQTSNGNAD